MLPDKLLTFERSWPQHSGHKEAAIRRELGITPARYYVLLHRSARSIDGMRADPITARRIRDRAAWSFRTMGYTVGYTAGARRSNEKGPSPVEA